MSRPLFELWYTRCPVPTAIGVAAQEDIFSRFLDHRDIAVRSLQDENVSAISHYDHSLASSFRQGGNIPALWARASGADTRLIGLSWIDEFQGILVRDDTSISQLSDIVGRTAGLPRRGGPIDFDRACALKGFTEIVRKAAIASDQLTLIDLAQQHEEEGSPSRTRDLGSQYAVEADALMNGEVDLIYVKGVEGRAIQRRIGARLLMDLGTDPDPLVRASNATPRTLTVDRRLLDTRPEIVDRFVAAVIAAGNWAVAHPQEAVAFIARETSSSPAAVRDAYGDHVHASLSTTLETPEIEALKHFKDFLVFQSVLPFDFDIDAWIDPEPLRRAAKLLPDPFA